MVVIGAKSSAAMGSKRMSDSSKVGSGSSMQRTPKGLQS
jgi:hypothetical protein